jgi:hypothetical protein
MYNQFLKGGEAKRSFFCHSVRFDGCEWLERITLTKHHGVAVVTEKM